MINKIINIISTIYCNVNYTLKGVRLGKKVLFKRVPSIVRVKGATIVFGNNIIINSDNNGYHLNMFAKCKIVADRKGAIITVGDNSRIHGTCLHAFNKIEIGTNCLIAANTNIIDSNGHKLSFDNVANRINTIDKGKEIIIEDNVWIGANCLILGGVKIGMGSIIAANSVVKNDIPSMCIAAGNPAVVIKHWV